MFCNSSARASIPSRALISFSRVLMVFSLKVSFQSSNNRKSYHRSPGAPLAFTPAIRCNLSAHLQLSSTYVNVPLDIPCGGRVSVLTLSPIEVRVGKFGNGDGGAECA